MKKIFQKLNSRTTRSVVFGLVIATALNAGTSYVVAQNNDTRGNIIGDTTNDITAKTRSLNVSTLPGSATNAIHRIGSLAINTSFPWRIDSESKCINVETTDDADAGTGTDSCFATGVATFSNIFVKKIAYFLDDVSVRGSTGFDGRSAFIVQTPAPGGGITDSLMASSLGYSLSGDATINPTPRNLVTQAGVCADTDGTMYRCGTSVVVPDPDPTPDPTNATCGSSHGTPATSAPTSNLCGAGTASSVTTGSGTYDWSCTGANGGTDATCSADITTSVVPINGVCDESVVDGCTSGTLDTTVFSDTATHHQWVCLGQNGGDHSTSVCSRAKIQNCSGNELLYTGGSCVPDQEKISWDGANGSNPVAFDWQFGVAYLNPRTRWENGDLPLFFNPNLSRAYGPASAFGPLPSCSAFYVEKDGGFDNNGEVTDVWREIYYERNVGGNAGNSGNPILEYDCTTFDSTPSTSVSSGGTPSFTTNAYSPLVPDQENLCTVHNSVSNVSCNSDPLCKWETPTTFQLANPSQISCSGSTQLECETQGTRPDCTTTDVYSTYGGCSDTSNCSWLSQ